MDTSPHVHDAANEFSRTNALMSFDLKKTLDWGVEMIPIKFNESNVYFRIRQSV